MRKPIVVIKLHPRDYDGHIVLGSRVAENMFLNSHFLSPTPSVDQITAALEAVVEAKTKSGRKGNRGSHADLMDLRFKTTILGGLLTSLSQYVMLTGQLEAGTDYALMAFILESSGVVLKKFKSPQGRLLAVRNLHQFISRDLARNQVRLQWAMPLAVTSACNVKSYKIYRSDTPSFYDATLLFTSTKTTFIDTNTSGEMVTWYYWIVPFGADGDGVPSKSLEVILPKA